MTTNSSLFPIVQVYLDYCRYEKRLASRSLAIYQNDLHYLSEFCLQNNIEIQDISSSQIRSCLAQLRLSGLKNSSLNLTLSSWRGFFKWLSRFHDLNSNPMMGIKSLPHEQRLPKALTVDDVRQLLNSDQASDQDNEWLQTRDQAIMELLYGSGLRVSELCALDTHAHRYATAWIDLDQSLVLVKGKGNKERIVPIGSYSKKALEQWLLCRKSLPMAAPPSQKLGSPPSSSQRDHEFALFIGQRGTRLTPQSIWQRLKRKAVLTEMTQSVHPHMLRHSFASHILQSSQDIRAVQELLGHANISTTQIYTKLDFQHLAKTYDASHPRARKNKDLKKG